MSIRFLLNDVPQTVDGVSTTVSLLEWLRSRGYTGTKEGCAEGDCGACTVVLAQFCAAGTIELSAINACIRFMPTLHGKAIYTVEALKGGKGVLHPVQQAMVDQHGSQCGFCTPGFVMSLWSVYENHPQGASRQDIALALSGNLCRCTGYRPILDSGEKMYNYPRRNLDRQALKKALEKLRESTSFSYQWAGERFDAPKTVEELTSLRAQFPAATILAGATDIGLWSTKQLRVLPHLIYLGDIAELQEIYGENGSWVIGAGASLEAAYAVLVSSYPQLRELWQRFASPPIRNVGTLGGNIANGSPIGDSMPVLIALGAEIVLASRRGQRQIAMEDFYIAYQKKAMEPDEVLIALRVPQTKAGWSLRTYKVSKRYDSDISAVCGAFALKLNGQIIEEVSIAFGGMAATPKRAITTELTLKGLLWNDDTARRAQQALQQDYQPLSDMRASSTYRLQVAQNLLYRFYLETRAVNPMPEQTVGVYASMLGETR